MIKLSLKIFKLQITICIDIECCGILPDGPPDPGVKDDRQKGHIIYTKDGKKILGHYDNSSKLEAKLEAKREARLQEIAKLEARSQEIAINFAKGQPALAGVQAAT